MTGLGDELKRELDAKLERIAQGPSAFRATPEDARACRAPLRRFPFWIIFRETSDAIVIVAFAHKKKQRGDIAARDERDVAASCSCTVPSSCTVVR